jgi:hypothetical protein
MSTDEQQPAPMNPRMGAKSGLKNRGYGREAQVRRVEVFSAYVKNPDQIPEWIDSLAFSEADQNA